MTVQPHTYPTTVAEAQRLVDATVAVDSFRADLRLACEARAFTDEFGDGLAARYFGGAAVIAPIGALIYLVRAGAAATRQKHHDRTPDCVNPWGIPALPSCAETVLLELENEAADALIKVLLHGPWPI
jgi:hypothetical protein